MEKGHLGLASKSRPLWVEFWGVPLWCWQKELFLKMGGVIGEALMVEYETCNMSRLDRGRVLVSIPFGTSCPDSIEVEIEGTTFVSMVVVDNQPVLSHWLENHLGLKSEVQFQNLNTYPVWENGGLGPDFGDKTLKSSDIGKTDKGVRVQQEMEGDVSLKHGNRGGVNRNVNSCGTEKVGKTGHSDSFSKKEKGKGKLQLFRKPIVRPTEQENRKAKVILEKKRSGCQNSGYECDTSSSSSDDEDDFWKDVRSGYVVGDCSRKLGPDIVRGKGGPDDGTLEIHDDRLIDGPLPLGTDSRAAQFWIDIGPKETSYEKSEAGDVEALTGSEGGTWVEETIFLDPNIGDPVVEICQGPKSGANEDCQIEEPLAEAEKNYNEEGQIGRAEVGTTVSKKRREKVSSSRTHGMKTRHSKRSQKGEDNNIQIQEEVHVSRSEGWELENEVAKVIETAIALGLDIEGREEEIRKVVARRELEDEALYAK
ncbi:hypothetical protein Q3G72_018902 [Acer saccharum]|nr:hypothetical protein Q3G72_018902 [Acer saccharum]